MTLTFLLSILASFAQEESRSVSENIKWRVRNDMKMGKTKPRKVYGYEVVDGNLVINPKEAETIRWVYDALLGGMGWVLIARELNKRGIPSPDGKKWSSTPLMKIIKNPKMCGDVLHQKTFVVDHISKKRALNKGELPTYLYEGAHEGIVSKETYEAAMAELERRVRIGGLVETVGLAFRKKVYCGGCGGRLCHSSNKHRDGSKYRTLVCYNRRKRICKATPQLMEEVLMDVTAKVLGLAEYDGNAVTERIERIILHPDRSFTFVFYDGTEIKTFYEGSRKFGKKRKGNPGE